MGDMDYKKNMTDEQVQTASDRLGLYPSEVRDHYRDYQSHQDELHDLCDFIHSQIGKDMTEDIQWYFNQYELRIDDIPRTWPVLIDLTT